MKASTLQVAQLVVAVTALFSGWVIAMVAVKTFARGPQPEKHLYSQTINSPNALDDLRQAHEVVTYSVVDAKGNTLENMYSLVVTLKNIGTAPILATDFFGKVRLTTKDPWVILTINGVSQTGAPSFTWHKLDNTTFEAEPVLINPGDEFTNVVYMTSTKPQEDLIPSPPITWDMRVVNMDHIDYGGSSTSASPLIPQLINVSVSYVGNSVLTLLIIFSLYLGIYVYYLCVAGQLSSPIITTLLIIPVGLWSLMAADVGETAGNYCPRLRDGTGSSHMTTRCPRTLQRLSYL